jgi:predicted DsbA family dithiol-disulfide isomerase
VRIEKLRQEWDIEVRIAHFPLHPNTPSEGLTLEQLFLGRGIDIPAALARMKRLMAEEQLPYGNRTMTYNSRLAQELACYAMTQQDGWRIHDRLFRAYFVDGINIASIEDLVAIATDIGLDAQECRKVLTLRTFRSSVDADWERSRQLGLTGVPAFVLGNSGLSGAHPYETLSQLVALSGAQRL